MPRLHVRKGRYGRGVFAGRDFARGDVLEISPVIVMKDGDVRASDRLSHYIFDWGKGCVAVALGVGSLFNHTGNAREQNAEFKIMKPGKSIIFTAMKRIAKGEEIFVHYGYDPRRYPMKKISCDD